MIVQDHMLEIVVYMMIVQDHMLEIVVYMTENQDNMRENEDHMLENVAHILENVAQIWTPEVHWENVVYIQEFLVGVASHHLESLKGEEIQLVLGSF